MLVLITDDLVYYSGGQSGREHPVMDQGIAAAELNR